MSVDKRVPDDAVVMARLTEEKIVFFRDINTVLNHDEEDAHVYTVGNSLKDRPELFAICGEFNVNSTEEELSKNTEAAASLLSQLVNNWDNSPVVLGQICQDYYGRKYLVDDPGKISHYLKSIKMVSANKFLEKKDYKVWMLIPLEVISRLAIKEATNVFNVDSNIAKGCKRERVLH